MRICVTEPQSSPQTCTIQQWQKTGTPGAIANLNTEAEIDSNLLAGHKLADPIKDGFTS